MIKQHIIGQECKINIKKCSFVVPGMGGHGWDMGGVQVGHGWGTGGTWVGYRWDMGGVQVEQAEWKNDSWFSRIRTAFSI